MFSFKFVNDNGKISHIIAEGRKAAISQYSQEEGCPVEFVKKHCLITNEGTAKK